MFQFKNTKKEDLDKSKLGGKAESLIKLTFSGFNVPEGFVISNIVYLNFIQENNLLQFLKEMIESLYVKDTSKWDTTNILEVSKAIEKKFLSLSFNEKLQKDIEEQIDEFKGKSFAVRSSGTSEDSEDFSFAGQHSTFLNVTKNNICKSIIQCWASLFSDRALFYRIHNNMLDLSSDEKIPQWLPQMCVIVQRLISSDVSGVIFTANPLNHTRKDIVINSSYGLGESIVSGLVTPDYYRIKKEDLKVCEKIISEKKIEIIRDEEGTKTVDVDLEKQKKESLDEKLCLELSKLALGIEMFYETSQDIEFGIENGKIYILQSRPITSLFPQVTEISKSLTQAIKNIDLPDKPVQDDYYHVYVCINHQQMFLDPFRPLGLSIFSMASELANFMNTTTVPRRVYTAGGRLYFDMSDILRIQNSETSMATKIDKDAAESIKEIQNRKEFQKNAPPLDYSFYTNLISMIPYYGIPIGWNFLFSDPKQLSEDYKKKNEKMLSNFKFMLKETKGNLEILNKIKKALESYNQELLDSIMNLVSGFLALSNISDEEQGMILLGLEGNVTTEMGLEVGDLSDIARKYSSVFKKVTQFYNDSIKNNKLPTTELLSQLSEDEEGEKIFKKEYSKFIEKYGHRCKGEIDITNERWKNDSSFIIHSIYSSMQSGNIGDHRKKQELNKKKAKEEIEKKIEKTKTESENSWWNTLSLGLYSNTKTSWMTRCIELSRNTMSLREHPKYFMIKTWERARELFLEIGSDLKKNGILENETDIFYFTIYEIEELVTKKFNVKDVQKLVKKRINEYKRYSKLVPPQILTSDGEDVRVPEKHDDNPNVFIGLGVSSGAYEGIARVIIDPLKDKLSNGEIMVCSHTDPGWTPLFNTCQGLVIETGGTLTHGSVVARELGLPAVVGIKNCTKKIKSGDTIKIDGRTGKVEIIKRVN